MGQTARPVLKALGEGPVLTYFIRSVGMEETMAREWISVHYISFHNLECKYIIV